MSADALMAFRRGDDSDEAYLGAMLIADHFSDVHALTRGWFKRYSK